MPRIKHTAARKSVVMKKLKKAAASAGAIVKGSGGGNLVHTGKLKMPFKKASDIKAAKKGIIKQLKRR